MKRIFEIIFLCIFLRVVLIKKIFVNYIFLQKTWEINKKKQNVQKNAEKVNKIERDRDRECVFVLKEWENDVSFVLYV